MGMLTPDLFASLLVLVTVFVCILASYLCHRLLSGTFLFKTRLISGTGSVAVFFALLYITFYFREDVVKTIDERASARSFRQNVAAPARKVRYGDLSADVSTLIFDPDAQIVSRVQLRDYDLSRFIVNEKLNIAFHRPSTSSPIHIENVDKIQSLAMTDIPGIRDFLDIFFQESRNAASILAVRENKEYDVIINEHSRINDLPIQFNPLLDPAVIKAFTESSIDRVLRIYPEVREEDIDIEEIQATIESNFSKYTDIYGAHLPIKQQISNGIYFSVIEPAEISQFLINKVIPRKTLLERAIQYVVFSGRFGIGGIENVFISNEEGVASFGGNISFEEVIIDGALERGTMNNLGFVIQRDSEILIVNFLYLSIGQSLSDLNRLQETFSSVRIARDSLH